jgi:hypothetical protein
VETYWHCRGAHAENARACRRNRCLRRSIHPLTHATWCQHFYLRGRTCRGAHTGGATAGAHMPGRTYRGRNCRGAHAGGASGHKPFELPPITVLPSSLTLPGVLLSTYPLVAASLFFDRITYILNTVNPSIPCVLINPCVISLIINTSPLVPVILYSRLINLINNTYQITLSIDGG